MLLSQSSVLLFLIIEDSFTGIDQLFVELVKLHGSLDRLRKVLSGSFPLEFLKLNPDLLRNLA